MVKVSTLQQPENSFSFVSEFIGRVFKSRLRKYLFYLLYSNSSPESSGNEEKKLFHYVNFMRNEKRKKILKLMVEKLLVEC